VELEHLKIETRLIDENLTRIDETRDLSMEVALTELLKLPKSGQCPDEPVRIKF
jgi:hypothetical protein